MRMIKTILAGTAGMAVLASAAPAAAQYYPYNSNGYNSNGYNSNGYNSYGYNSYGSYGYGVNSNVAAQQCTAAVQNRLYSRTSLGSILGSMVGIPTRPQGRVVSITSSTPTRFGMRVRGLASSGRYAYNNYGQYGYGAYGSLGYGYNAAADLSWRCDVDISGNVRNVDINHR